VIIAVDTNIITGLWLEDDPFSDMAEEALEKASKQGSLMIVAAVYAELLATPGKSRVWLDGFLDDVGIKIDWVIKETIWLEAGQSYALYAERRRREGKESPRRILADFLIGAHAFRQADKLLTSDAWYKTNFPKLKLELVQ
jgi:predicted nucleic acid-binding protein